MSDVPATNGLTTQRRTHLADDQRERPDAVVRTESDTLPLLLSVDELADYLGLSKMAVYGMNHDGTAPPRIRVGRQVRYRLPDVRAWLEAREVHSAPEASA